MKQNCIFNEDLFQAITFEWYPNTFYSYTEEGLVDYQDLYGLDVDIFQAIRDVLEFDLEYSEPPSGELWGEPQQDGTWTGLVGMINRKEADFGLANMYVSPVRLPAIDFSAPYYMDVRKQYFLI